MLSTFYITEKKKKFDVGKKYTKIFTLSTQRQIGKDALRKEMGIFIPSLGFWTEIAVPVLMLTFLTFSPCSISIFLRATVVNCAVKTNGLTLFTLPNNFLMKGITTGMDVFVMTYVISQAVFAIGAVFNNGAICITDGLQR